MARINLLPWRAERRAQRQREFYGMLGLAAIAGVLLSILIWFHYSQQVAGQKARNQFLTDEITKVEQQNEEIKALDRQKERLLARKQVIEQLQADRSQMVHLFDSLVRTIPDGVVLRSIKQEGEILTLEGRAQSNARVSTYMRNLEGSGWMTQPDLSIIEAKSEDAKGGAPVGRALPYAFSLRVKLATPDPDAAPVAGEDTSSGTSADAQSAGAGAAATEGAAQPSEAATTPAEPEASAPGTPEETP